MNKKPCHFISLVYEFINADESIKTYRTEERFFTRKRKMPFNLLALMMLGLLRKTLALELNSFYSKIDKKFQEVSQSAFIQNRYKVKPKLFYQISSLIATDYYIDNDANVKLYKNHRLLAVDGSMVNLPVTEDTVEHYGYYNNQNETNDIVLGRVSVLYDVLNNIALDGLLRNCEESEGTLFKAHLSMVQPGDLIAGDRNYPSFNSAYEISERQCEFLFRCKINFNKLVCTFVESSKKEWITDLAPQQGISFKNLPYDKNERIKVRLIKVELESGETEILMTSLLDKKKYPFHDFKDLYFQRWGVETYYDRFKHIIEVERFSGKSHQFIQQEFNCALYISNMQSILTQDIEVEKEIKVKTKNRKWEYKVNQSVSLGFIREKIISIFIVEKKESKELLKELQKLFVRNLIPIRPDRNYKRNTSKYRHRVKPKQFSNRRLLL